MTQKSAISIHFRDILYLLKDNFVEHHNYTYENQMYRFQYYKVVSKDKQYNNITKLESTLHKINIGLQVSITANFQSFYGKMTIFDLNIIICKHRYVAIKYMLL